MGNYPLLDPSKINYSSISLNYVYPFPPNLLPLIGPGTKIIHEKFGEGIVRMVYGDPPTKIGVLFRDETDGRKWKNIKLSLDSEI
jgi:hypothetical protein